MKKFVFLALCVLAIGASQQVHAEEPPGILVFDQFEGTSSGGVRSYYAPNYSQNRLAAGDFYFDQLPGDLSFVKWSWTYPTKSKGKIWSEGFYVRIYTDQSCSPGNMVYETYIDAKNDLFQIDESLGNVESMWAYLDPVFKPAIGTTYWLSIQSWEGQGYGYGSNWITIDDEKGCPESMEQLDPPNGDWTALQQNRAPRFALYASEPVPVPIPNWALFLAIGLIAGFLLLRLFYR
ncbi:MAG: hypothetical protein IH598_01895 [Bacteroidales bacterium]|nr:hypothetical protein [Bacteroidales bacterium]